MAGFIGIRIHTVSGGIEDFTVTLDSSAKAEAVKTMNAAAATTGNMDRGTMFSSLSRHSFDVRGLPTKPALVGSVGQDEARQVSRRSVL
jgi:hypothetical protein